MAKISARGATKIAQANKEWRDEDGYDHRQRIALRSDGALLRAHDLRSPSMREAYGSRGWNRGGYSIALHEVSLMDFHAHADKHGYTLKP